MSKYHLLTDNREIFIKKSGQVNVKISQQVAIFGGNLPFYTGQKWVNIFTNRSGQPDRFFAVFFLNPSLTGSGVLPNVAGGSA